MFISEKLQIPKAKTEVLYTLDQSYGIRQASSHTAFEGKVKRLILNDDVP